MRTSYKGQRLFVAKNEALNKLEKDEYDNETIGLLLCKEADKFVTETTLESSNSLIGVSKYKFLDELPDYLNKRLNNNEK